ncbi:MAG: hypothetical protein H6622_14055 [Halobacteriovoraceae bacterium]|nr:hypothetical protein [Halobacteriovoraceae bacterium]
MKILNIFVFFVSIVFWGCDRNQSEIPKKSIKNLKNTVALIEGFESIFLKEQGIVTQECNTDKIQRIESILKKNEDAFSFLKDTFEFETIVCSDRENDYDFKEIYLNTDDIDQKLGEYLLEAFKSNLTFYDLLLNLSVGDQFKFTESLDVLKNYEKILELANTFENKIGRQIFFMEALKIDLNDSNAIEEKITKDVYELSENINKDYEQTFSKQIGSQSVQLDLMYSQNKFTTACDIKLVIEAIKRISSLKKYHQGLDLGEYKIVFSNHEYELDNQGFVLNCMNADTLESSLNMFLGNFSLEQSYIDAFLEWTQL